MSKASSKTPQQLKRVPEAAAAVGSKSGAGLLALSGSLGSGATSVGTFRAMQEVSIRCNDLLNDLDANVKLSDIWHARDMELERLEMFTEKADLTPTLTDFSFNTRERQLVKLGSEVSDLAYGTAAKRDTDLFLPNSESKGKPVYIRPDTVDGESVLVIGIRGTAKWRDWPLNLDNSPLHDTKVVSDTIAYHKGFWEMANEMEVAVAQAITYYRNGHKNLRRVLFTGHSAGGAIAHIFLVLSRDHDSLLGRSIGSLAVDCVTFGAPPVRKPTIELNRSQTFLSIVNEGDLVALAQNEYIKILMAIFVLPKGVLMERARDFEPHDPFYDFSGKIVLLRDILPEDPSKSHYRACTLEASEFKKFVFGSIAAHHRAEYWKRLDGVLAT